MTSIAKPGHQGLRNLSRKSDDVAEFYDGWAQDYDQTLAALENEGPSRAPHVSEPMTYLPENEEFRDEIKVYYISCTVL